MAYIATRKDAGVRIDLVIMDIRPEITRSTIKKIIIDGLITVNSNKIMPNYRFKEGDSVEFNEREIQAFIRQGYGLDILKPRQMDFDVIYEDENTLVVDKPSGLNSHPVVKKDSQSILNGVIWYLNKLKMKNEKLKIIQNTNDKQRTTNNGIKPRLVHRLDRETSGVLLFAKNLEAHEFYSKQFEEREVKKTYFAVVHKDFKKFLEKREEKFLHLSSYISKEHDQNKRFFNTTPEKGKMAKTQVYFERYFNKFGKFKFSLVKVVPETGRTHQIRVHLSSAGFPILGDSLYGGQKYKRLMLHAYSLSIPIFTQDKSKLGKEWKTFTAKLPDKFEG